MAARPPRARPRPRPREERRDGRRIALLYREQRGLVDTRCCNLEELLEQDDIVLAHSDSERPGYAACLIKTDGVCGIILPNGQSGGRRRFSIAHELGHCYIPSHSNVSGFCSDADLRVSESDKNLQEWEANDFAAELLMPRKLFGADADARGISIASAIELAGAGFYDVSVMAAALRVVDTTRERAALVVSSNSRVMWSKKSENFRLWLPGYGDRLDHDTMASASFRRVETSERPKPVPLEAWARRSRTGRGELLESTYRIDSQEQVVSLLWYVEDDPELGDDD
jgi:Zn-dependent peptidase ImmA (M78 family)